MAKADVFVSKFIDLYMQQQAKSSTGLYSEDPTVLGFSLWFYFVDIPTGLNRTPSPLFSEQPGTDSAILYLENIGEARRANSLREFKERLRLLVQETPHYLQTLDGMANINKFDPSTPFRGLDRKLTINTLESIDLRVSTMIARYMDAVYDFENHRQMVPNNLLFFSCYLMVNEIRSMRMVINAKAEDDSTRYKLLSESIGIHAWRLEMCKFDFEATNPWLEMLDNRGGDSAANRFSVDVGRVVDQHQLDFLQLASGSMPDAATINVPALPLPAGFPTTIKDRARDTADFIKREIIQKGQLLQQNLDPKTLGQRALNDLFDQLDSKVRGFILGNVFSDLNQFISNDFYTSTKEFINNIVTKNQTTRQAAENAFANGGPPEIIETKIGQLGQVALAVLKQQELPLGNVSGFATDPFKAIENHILAGSLGNVFDKA